MSTMISSDDDINGAPSEELEVKNHVSVIDHLEGQLRIGNEVPSIEKCYYMYAEYGRCKGFGVRRGKQSFFKGTSKVRLKEFYCSCSGFFANKKTPIVVVRKYSRQHVRTGCPALLRIVRPFGKPWVVTKFLKNHNHELLQPDHTYLLRSARNVSTYKKTVLDALHAAGVGPACSFRFMENQAGGVQHVGFTKVDVFNHADQSKQFTRVQNGDARALMDFCVDKSNTEHAFHWNVKLDSEGRLMNIYFRDSRCLTDYEAFGDVLLVDTTYRTNKYNIVVAPFVGINHHNQNILFGVGFLSSETTSSFMWLFSAFLDSMQGKQPQVIFTDQCQAMMSAIDDVFPEASHRLCHWHISRNAPAHLGVLSTNKEFMRMWRRCMKGVETEAEFEELWDHLKENYGIKDKTWFSTMYNIKRRWASVFTQDKFSCGMVATSRSEATNHSLKQSCDRTHSLYEFVQCYERMKTEWRNQEVKDDVSNIAKPGRRAPANTLLYKASCKLTRAAYTLFENQMVSLLDYDIVAETPNEAEGVLTFKIKRMKGESDVEEDDDFCVDSDDETRLKTFDTNGVVDSEPNKVSDNDDDKGVGARVRTVQLDPLTNRASCTCMMWESMGILCRHILKVYNQKNIKVLPDIYLLPRWCKDAKLRLLEARRTSSAETKSDCLDRLAYVNFFRRLANDVSDECQYVPMCRTASLNKMIELKRLMGVMMDTHRSSFDEGEKRGGEFKMSDAQQPRNPPVAERRGKSKKSDQPPKSHWDSKKKKKAGAVKNPSPKKKFKTGDVHTSFPIHTLPHEQSPFGKSGDCPPPFPPPLIPGAIDIPDQSDIDGILGTQLSSVNESSEVWVDIADVWATI